jgi:hypothetical protein
MIARVRIAPVERWCWWYKPPTGRENIAARLPGLEVAIETASMRAAECDPDARMWDLLPESEEQLDLLIHGSVRHTTAHGICEHVLEMD